ncbi:MAG: hypothetical protein SVY53_01440 [Chloroflexota bacterium]|nr:hypothetical protein [Chloroflexota bacterium]
MADYRVHLSQARHNEEIADKLVQEPPFHDWAVTAAFYAAIHYFECWMFNSSHKHSETSIPMSNGKIKYSPHTWRQLIVEKEFDKPVWKSFRKLRDGSQTARYLSPSRPWHGVSPRWLNKPASDYFTPEAARKMVENNLAILKAALDIPSP